MSFNENQHKGNYFQQKIYHSVEWTYNDDIMRNYMFETDLYQLKCKQERL